MVTAVDEQNPFAHVLRQGGKLPLPAAQGVHLPANGAVLLPQAADQGKELLIGLIQPGVFQIQAVDGLVICRDSREARIPDRMRASTKIHSTGWRTPRISAPTVVSTQEIRKTVPSDRRAA